MYAEMDQAYEQHIKEYPDLGSFYAKENLRKRGLGYFLGSKALAAGLSQEDAAAWLETSLGISSGVQVGDLVAPYKKRYHK